MGKQKHTALPWVYDPRYPGNVYSDDVTGSIIATCAGFRFCASPGRRDCSQCRIDRPRRQHLPGSRGFGRGVSTGGIPNAIIACIPEAVELADSALTRFRSLEAGKGGVG